MVVVAMTVTLALLVMLGTILHNLWFFPRLAVSTRAAQTNRKTPVRSGAQHVTRPTRLGQQSARCCNSATQPLNCLCSMTIQTMTQDRWRPLRPPVMHVFGCSPVLPYRRLGRQKLGLSPVSGGGPQYELLLFTDADVQWQPAALQAVVDLQQNMTADIAYRLADADHRSWGERLVHS